MTTALKVAKVVGLATDGWWSQVYVASGLRGEEETDERVMVAVAIKKETEEEGGEIGREVLKKIETRYGQIETTELGARLQELVNGLVEEYRQEELELSMAVIRGSQVGVVAVGAGGGVLLREGEWGWVAKGDERGVVRMGKLTGRDRLILGTGRFFELAGVKSLKEMEKEKLNEIEESLTMGVQSEGGGGVAALVVEMEDEHTGEKDKQEERKVMMEEVRVGGQKTEKTRTKLKEKWMGIGRGRRQPQVYLKNGRQKKVALSVGVVLLLMLVVSVGLGWQKRVETQRKQEFNQVYEPIKKKYDEAVMQAEVDQLVARQLLKESQMMVEEGLSKFELDTKERGAVDELKREIDELYIKVGGEVEIEEAEVFFELSLVREDLYGKEMAVAGNKLVVLDEGHGVVVTVEIESKKSEVVGGGEILIGAKLMGTTEGRALVLSDKGLVGLWFNDREPEVLKETDDEWQSPIKVAMFGGNGYLLDAGKGELWRYPGYEGGLGTRSRWLGPGVVPDFSRVVDMVIDGDIWIIDDGGKISHYRRGAPVSFTLVGLDEPMSKPKAMDTSEDGESLYILDRGQSRVVVVDKEGDYKRQYKWSGMAAVDDIATDEASGKIFLLSGASIYVISLNE